MSTDRIRLRVGDRWYGGWKGVTVTRDLDRVASEWDMDASNAWADIPLARRPVAGDEVQVYIGGHQALDGYIEQDNDAYDKESSSLTFGGRSLVGDLVDSAAPAGVYRSLTLGQLADVFAAPFGVGVRVDSDTERITHRVVPGETIIASLQRAAAPHQKILADAPDGQLVITEGGRGRAVGAIVRGQRGNVLAGNRAVDLSQRYRFYSCRGQTVAEGAALDSFEESIVDDVFGSGRPRTLALQHESGGPRRTASGRVRVEAARRAGRSHVYIYTVQGWTQTRDGRLWDVNETVPVTDPRYGLDAYDLLITRAQFGISNDGGSITTMTLAPAVGWVPIPVQARKAPTVRTGALVKDLGAVQRAVAGGLLSPTRSKERTP